MKMIILAAGRGERLMPLTANTPKSLIEISDGLTLLESQLRNIHQAGIRDVVIVGGYRVEQIEAKIRMYEEEFKMNIKVLYNPFFMTSNNLVSLWLAKHEMNEDFIILNGDDVFEHGVLSGLMEKDASLNMCMVIARKSAYTEEDMKVTTQGDRVVAVGKTIDALLSNGESIGMIRVSGVGRKVLTDKLEAMVRKEESKKVFYLRAFCELMESGWPVHYHEILPTQWAEIDFHPDLTMVRSQIKIQSAANLK